MMRLLSKLVFFLFFHLVARRRRPDQIIGTPNKPYLLRWWISRHPQPDAITHATGWRKRWLQWRSDHGAGLYLHLFLRSDDDRAHHDHPWNWASWLLQGSYMEHRHESPEYLFDSAVPAYGADRVEVTDIRRHYDDPVRVVRTFSTGSVRSGRAEDAHRIELHRSPDCVDVGFDLYGLTIDEQMDIFKGDRVEPVWTLLFMGNWQRDWGFHCPKGWVPWREFTDPTTNGNQTGAGCGEVS